MKIRTLIVLFVAWSCTNSLLAGEVSKETVPSANQLKSLKVARSNDTAHKTPKVEFGSSSGFELSILDPNPAIPRVLLSSGHKKTCLKRIGDQLDDISIENVHGESVNVKQQLSKQLTVLIFWSEKSVAGYEQFRRIPIDVLRRFAAHGVKVIAVNVGGSVEETRRLTGNADEMIVSLADEDSKLFKQFATESVPRTYVLDAQGRITWFDVEYSESTRRSLSNALTYFIKQNAAPGATAK